MAPPERHSAIAAALGDPLRLPFGICDEGARVVFQDRRAFEEARR